MLAAPQVGVGKTMPAPDPVLGHSSEILTGGTIANALLEEVAIPHAHMQRKADDEDVVPYSGARRWRPGEISVLHVPSSIRRTDLEEASNNPPILRHTTIPGRSPPSI
ncbi:MAG TPA: hypothetical protein VMV57_05215 [Terracidiphilus sp.]|nr:hypothetical protein [Terracidiphilus sp.]